MCASANEDGAIELQKTRRYGASLESDCRLDWAWQTLASAGLATDSNQRL